MSGSSTQMREKGTLEIFVAYAWEIQIMSSSSVAGWSSLVARQAHNLKVAGSNPAPAPNLPTFRKPFHILFIGAFSLADFSNFAFLFTSVISIHACSIHPIQPTNLTLTPKKKTISPRVYVLGL